MMRTRKPVVKITLQPPLKVEAERRAEAVGLPVEAWLEQIVESHLVSERCRHHGAPPAPPPAPDAEAP